MNPSPAKPTTIRLGARGSLLSRLQSGIVARMLESAHPHVRVELVAISTSGDRIHDRPLHDFGGKGLFTKEIEQDLVRGEIDLAVHSYKDVPVTMPLVDSKEILAISATPPREDPRDVLLSEKARSIAELPLGAKVGTGSLRRQAQLLALRPDLQVLPIRGNVDTRLRKLKSGEYDAIILALAGLKRAGLFDPSIMTPLATDQFLPAAGQGALALQCRSSDADLLRLLEPLNDSGTALAVQLEREVVRLLDGDCHSPIAALATLTDSHATLQALVAARDGKPPLLRAQTTLDRNQAPRSPAIVADNLKSQGAQALLASPS